MWNNFHFTCFWVFKFLQRALSYFSVLLKNTRILLCILFSYWYYGTTVLLLCYHTPPNKEQQQKKEKRGTGERAAAADDDVNLMMFFALPPPPTVEFIIFKNVLRSYYIILINSTAIKICNTCQRQMLQINTWSRHSVCIIFACIPATSYQLYTKHESQTLLPLTFPCANFLRFKRSNFLCRLLSSFNVSLQWFKSHGSISLKSLITFIDSDFIKGCQCDLAFFCSAGKIFGSIFFRF